MLDEYDKFIINEVDVQECACGTYVDTLACDTCPDCKEEIGFDW